MAPQLFRSLLLARAITIMGYRLREGEYRGGIRREVKRKNRGWSQDELAEKLYVSRQSISKWENDQNYPSIEIIIKLSDLFGVTIDELLRSDEELTKKVINDGKQLAYPKVKITFDILFLIGAALMVTKFTIFLLNISIGSDVSLPGGPWVWSIGALVLMIGGGIGSDSVKDKYKTD